MKYIYNIKSYDNYIIVIQYKMMQIDDNTNTNTNNNKMIPIGQIIQTCLVALPTIRPKYDAKRMDLYFGLDLNSIVRFLTENCDNPNYDDELMSQVIQLHDKQILKDLRHVLLETIMDVYMPDYEKNPEFQRDKYGVQEECIPHLFNNLQSLIFKRTANTCTPYGFI